MKNKLSSFIYIYKIVFEYLLCISLKAKQKENKNIFRAYHKIL